MSKDSLEDMLEVMRTNEAPSWKDSVIQICVMTILAGFFTWLLVLFLVTLKKVDSPVQRLERGDEVIVITDHGQYSLLFYSDIDFLRCTDKEGKIHVFRGNYEVHERSELSPEVVDHNIPHSDVTPIPETLLR